MSKPDYELDLQLISENAPVPRPSLAFLAGVVIFLAAMFYFFGQSA